jgi:hypothetical protein
MNSVTSKLDFRKIRISGWGAFCRRKASASGWAAFPVGVFAIMTGLRGRNAKR